MGCASATSSHPLLLDFLLPPPPPPLQVTIISRHPADEVLVMASDGLWDVMSNQEAVTLAKKCLGRARSRGSTRQVSTLPAGAASSSSACTGQPACSTWGASSCLSWHSSGWRRRFSPHACCVLTPTVALLRYLPAALPCRVLHAWLPRC